MIALLPNMVARAGRAAVTSLLAVAVANGTALAAEESKGAPPPAANVDPFGDPLPDGAIARVGTIRLRANDSINVVAFSPDGRHVAYGSEDGVVHVCEAADGKPLFQLQPGTRHQPVTELTFSPDGKSLAASGFWSKSVWILDVATQEVRLTIPNTAETQNRWARLWQGPGIAFTPDSRTLIVGGKDGALHFCDAATGADKAVAPGTDDPVLSLTVTPDGRTALTAHYAGALRLWDVPNRKHVRKLVAAAKYPHLTAMAADGKTVALAAGAEQLELWEVDGGRRHELPCAALVVGLGFTPDGASLRVAEGDGNITEWDVRTGKKAGPLHCDGISIRRMDDPKYAEKMGQKPSAWFRPDGKAMAWVDGLTVRPWDLTTKQESPRWIRYHAGVAWTGFSADGRLLRVGGARGELGVWDAATGRPHAQHPKTDRTTWAPRHAPAADRSRIVVVTPGADIVMNAKPGEGRIFVWDPAGDAGPIPLRDQDGPAWCAALTPDNRFIVATQATGKIRVYDAASGKPTRSFDGDKFEYRLTFSPDGALLATTGSTGTIRVYDFGTGKLMRELKGVSQARCVAFSPDGRLLASGHINNQIFDPRRGAPNDSICLWDTASGRELRRILPSGHDTVQALAFSPDGRLLASGGWDRTVRLWETASAQERRRYDGHESWVQWIDFAPDGGRLAAANMDGTALVWQVFDPAPAQRSAEDLKALWADLAKGGTTAHRAMAGLVAVRETAGFISGSIRPAVKPTDDQVKKWIGDLGSTDFATRETAHEALLGVCELIEPALRVALKAAADAEVRRRLNDLLEKIPHVESRPDRLRELRAVEVLEHIGTEKARATLRTLAAGAPGALSTEAAKEALARPEKAPAKP
jgi:WD40 repeat protein